MLKFIFCLVAVLHCTVKGQVPIDHGNPLGMPPLFLYNPVPDRTNCPYHPVPVDLPSPLPPALTDAVNNSINLLGTVINPSNMPCVGYSLTYKDKTLFSGGLGLKAQNGKEKPDGNTIFRIGSVSKVFATMVLYQLFDRGMVKSLDDDITMYCPDFKMMTNYNTTLRMLASQLSGLPREAPCGLGTPEQFCNHTTKEILAGLQKQRTILPPWTRPSYSNLAYSLLGHCLVENLFKGTTYEDYVTKNILMPLKMKDTGFAITNDVKARMATGYNPDGTVAALTDLGWISPAGQMYSTTNDLNKLAMFFMSDSSSKESNAFLSPSVRKQMLLPVFINRDQKTGFGTPWEILFRANYTILVKGGNVGGYSALFSMVPELNLGVNMLFSGAVDEFTIAQETYDLLIPVFLTALKARQPKYYPYPPNPASYEGTYSVGVPNQPNVTIKTFESNYLIISTFDLSYYLSYEEELLFKLEYNEILMPCMTGEVLAAKGEYVYFAALGSDGKSTTFTIPGLFTGIMFSRIV